MERKSSRPFGFFDPSCRGFECYYVFRDTEVEPWVLGFRINVSSHEGSVSDSHRQLIMASR